MTAECSPWSPAEGEKKRRLEAERERLIGGGVWVRNKTERDTTVMFVGCAYLHSPQGLHMQRVLGKVFTKCNPLCAVVARQLHNAAHDRRRREAVV